MHGAPVLHEFERFIISQYDENLRKQFFRSSARSAAMLCWSQGTICFKRPMNELKSLRSFLRCVSFCTADSYDLLGLSNYFRKKGYFTRLLRDVLHVTSL